MIRPNTDRTSNKPVTLLRNQLLIRYAVTSLVHTVTIRGNVTSVYAPLSRTPICTHIRLNSKHVLTGHSHPKYCKRLVSSQYLVALLHFPPSCIMRLSASQPLFRPVTHVPHAFLYDTAVFAQQTQHRSKADDSLLVSAHAYFLGTSKRRVPKQNCNVTEITLLAQVNP